MDPITQGLVGASLPQAVASSKKHAAIAGLFGMFGGMAADLDVLIRSNTDPLLFLEYHRQFTHSLIFIPLGGLLCALVLHAIFASRWRLSFFRIWLFCTLGYSTHALLDACTSYGTQLLWPLSDERFAWNTMSIVDPLYTLPLLLLVVITALRRSPLFARIALAWVVAYPVFGLVQRGKAIDVGWALAQQRGHSPQRLDAKPSFGNVLLWKIVYETEDRFYIDAVRVGKTPRIYPGESVAKLSVERDFPWLDQLSQQAEDIRRFSWFSNGYVATDPENGNILIDVRYSMLPNEIAPLWHIELSPQASSTDHVIYRTERDFRPVQRDFFFAMLMGK